MFVSILQLMGFLLSKPVNSRAEEDSPKEPSKDRRMADGLKVLKSAANTKQTNPPLPAMYIRREILRGDPK